MASPAPRSRPRRPRALLVALALVLVASGAAVVTASPAQAADRRTVMASAAAYGPAHDYKIGIAVYDTKLHRLYGSGPYRSTFASESVIKVMIATRLILQGRMHGSTATRAYKMITQSDDGIASSFYGSVGGDGLITWIKRRYHVPDLGSPPHRAGWWGNNHITPVGLVKLYAKLKWDRRVGPWLLNAMHHARTYGSDGTYQFFGLPSATSHAAVKQGWGIDYDDWGRSADFNTTGFVNSDRYTVAILARGPSSTYGGAIGDALTQTARRLLPGGRFPDPDPVIKHMSQRSGTTLGGQRVTVRGTDLTGATAVYFGSLRGASLRVISSTALAVTTPAHAPGQFSVRVRTSHGLSSVRSYFVFVRPPTVTSLSPASGPVAGGTAVLVRGTDFSRVWSVWFGSRRATSFRLLSTGSIRAIAPPGTAQTVPVAVHTSYGFSPRSTAGMFTYVSPAAPPAEAPGSAAGSGSATGSPASTAPPAPAGSESGSASGSVGPSPSG